ncbi:peptidase C39 [Anaerocolumna sp. AGMB13025]|uniref:peptidase C39 n=1 Tax=Anaerocolumna sp. AGMB13025 TaxID=3039116 RepID=UPI00241D91C3|nr:peptidase C39 [Anaerocolumna sp. AGMB13025]WFR58296.1 peptidase C39 [Anaerocolumna sp. AGMB13025]
MKNQLCYQTSEYDCGPTTLINAFRYLFEREDIMPEIIKTIYLYTLDEYNSQGEYGKSGTSRMAMQFLSNWFNHFRQTKNFPVYTEILMGDSVRINKNSKIAECLLQGGAAVARVWLDTCEHYILLTDVERDYMCLFDPYEWEKPIDGTEVQRVEGCPCKMNRKVKMELMNKDGKGYYTLGAMEKREIMLLYNVNTRRTPDKSIEYFI